MQIGIVGLGRMGGNIARRLIGHGHEAIVYDHEPEAVAALANKGAAAAGGLEDLVRKLGKPRITSWLLDLTASGLANDPGLDAYSCGFVEDSGEGRWTVQAAIAQAVPAEVLSAPLFARFRSRREHT